MAQSVVLLVVLLFLHFWASCSPTAATTEPRRYAPFHCSNASSAPIPQCFDGDPIIDWDWWADMDCSEPDSISITYFDSKDPRSRVIVNDPHTLIPMEVRLECYPAGGIDQDEALICWSGSFSRTGGPYEFTNLSAIGILPGWECNISACFRDAEDDEIVFRTEDSSCILPGTSVSTSTSAPRTLDSTAATVDTVNATSETSTELDFNVHLENLNIYLPVLMTLTIIMLCVVFLIGVIFTPRVRRHLERKRALLMYNKESMVFDPHFYPSVCIDKPAFSRSPMMSMVSINLLQSLDLTPNIYVKEHPDYIPINEDKQSSLNFETIITDDSDAGSIDLSNPIVAQKIHMSKRSSDDISSTHTEIIVESQGSVERTCPQSDGACSVQNMVSSEQGYVQLPHYQQGSALSPTTITKLDCPSDDNDSVVTEILSNDNQFEETTHVAERKTEKHSTSGYVQSSSIHTACAVKQEMHSTSGYVQSSAFSMPLKEGTHSDRGYVQSSAVSMAIESKDEPTNTLDFLFSDETCDDSNPYQSNLNHTAMEGCQEASVYFHLAPFHSAVGDQDYPNSGYSYLQDTMTLHHPSTTNKSDQAYRVEKTENSHSDSPVVFHPPTITDNKTRPNTCASSESSLSQKECLRPISSSGVFTNSSNKSTLIEPALLHNVDPDSSTNGYLPSELFTRKILVPANHDSPATAGFVVHLDFENGHQFTATNH